MAASGQHRKKAILVISDGNDTSSNISPGVLRTRIRESDVLVYTLGVDSTTPVDTGYTRLPPFPTPRPFPWPGAGRGTRRGQPPIIFGGGRPPQGDAG